MKLLQYIILVCCFIVELGWNMFVGYGTYLDIDAKEEMSPNHTLPMDFCLLSLGIMFMVVTICGIVRVKRGKNPVIFSGLLIKIVIFCICSGFLYIAMGRKYYAATVFMWIIAMIFFALAYYYSLVKSGRIKKKSTYGVNNRTERYHFTSDKAKWAWDAAAVEYCENNAKEFSALTDDENELIYEYAGTSIAMFLLWLVRHNYMSDTFYSEMASADEIEKLKNLELNPVRFFASNMDYVLCAEDISDKIMDFVDFYYGQSFNQYMPNYSLDFDSYERDYYSVIRNGMHLVYCVDYSVKNYLKLEKIIDGRFADFMISDEEYEMEQSDVTVEWKECNATVNVEIQPGCDEAYVKKCVEHFRGICSGDNEEIIDMICEQIVAYDVQSTESDNGRSLLKQLNPDTVSVYTPLGNDIAYVIGCEPDFEEEHGLSIMIRENIVVEVGYRMDVGNPWHSDSDNEYRIISTTKELHPEKIKTLDDVRAYVDKGLLKECRKIPVMYGTDNSETVYVPPVVAEIKEKCDIYAEYYYLTGRADSYDCEIIYFDKSESLIPGVIRVIAKKGDKCMFFGAVHVWYSQA